MGAVIREDLGLWAIDIGFPLLIFFFFCLFYFKAEAFE